MMATNFQFSLMGFEIFSIMGTNFQFSLLGLVIFPIIATNFQFSLMGLERPTLLDKCTRKSGWRCINVLKRWHEERHCQFATLISNNKKGPLMQVSLNIKLGHCTIPCGIIMF